MIAFDALAHASPLHPSSVVLVARSKTVERSRMLGMTGRMRSPWKQTREKGGSSGADSEKPSGSGHISTILW